MRELKVGDRVKIVIEGRLDYLDDSGLKINGKVYDTGEYSHIEKLSSEQPTLTLEPGKAYVAKDGSKVECLMIDNDLQQPAICKRNKELECYNLNGTYCEGSPGSNCDIIGPWNPKPVVDWSLYSKWTKAVAQIGIDRIWAACNSIPLKTYDCYYVDGLNISLKIPPEYAPKNADGTPWVGNWEDSLVVRRDEE